MIQWLVYQARTKLKFVLRDFFEVNDPVQQVQIPKMVRLMQPAEITKLLTVQYGASPDLSFAEKALGGGRPKPSGLGCLMSALPTVNTCDRLRAFFGCVKGCGVGSGEWCV
jgi:hypothetical protein